MTVTASGRVKSVVQSESVQSGVFRSGELQGGKWMEDVRKGRVRRSRRVWY